MSGGRVVSSRIRVMSGVSRHGGDGHGASGVHGSDGGSSNNLGRDQVTVGRVRNGRVGRHFFFFVVVLLGLRNVKRKPRII